MRDQIIKILQSRIQTGQIAEDVAPHVTNAAVVADLILAMRAPAVGVTREAALALVDKIRGNTRDGWGYGREECANFILALSPVPDATVSDEIAPEQSAWLNERAAERRQMWTEHATHGGWQAVPKEPTKEMIQACIWALDRWREQKGNVQGFVPPGEKHQVRWRAMLAAAPSSPKHVGRDAAVSDFDPASDPVSSAIMGAAKLHTHDHEQSLKITRTAMTTISAASVSARDAVIEELQRAQAWLDTLDGVSLPSRDVLIAWYAERPSLRSAIRSLTGAPVPPKQGNHNGRI